MTGEIEKEDSTLVIKRIHVTYELADVDESDRATVDRVLGFHAGKCPVARSISPQIVITTSVEYV